MKDINQIKIQDIESYLYIDNLDIEEECKNTIKDAKKGLQLRTNNKNKGEDLINQIDSFINAFLKNEKNCFDEDEDLKKLYILIENKKEKKIGERLTVDTIYLKNIKKIEVYFKYDVNVFLYTRLLNKYNDAIKQSESIEDDDNLRRYNKIIETLNWIDESKFLSYCVDWYAVYSYIYKKSNAEETEFNKVIEYMNSVWNYFEDVKSSIIKYCNKCVEIIENAYQTE